MIAKKPLTINQELDNLVWQDIGNHDMTPTLQWTHPSPHNKQCKENTTKETTNIINGIKFLLVASVTRRQVDAKAQLFLDNINYTWTLTLFHIIMSINTILFIQPVGKIKNGQSLNIHKKISLKMRTRTVRPRKSKMGNNATWKDKRIKAR